MDVAPLGVGEPVEREPERDEQPAGHKEDAGRRGDDLRSRLADNLEVAQKNSHDWGISARGAGYLFVPGVA